VKTARTPGMARAADASIDLILAWAIELRKMAACHCPSRRISSTYSPRPRRKRRSSTRSIGAPM
jgi:hypothetical protein